MKKKRPRIGDVFKITLSDARIALGQYVFQDKQMGPLVQVFDLIAEDATLEQIKNAKPLFPPVITGLFAAIRTGLWEVVGNMEVKEFIYPQFISPLYDDKIGEVRMWYLWDGENYIRLGRKLPEEYRQLEQLIVWDPNNLTRRIETGENPLDYLLDR